VKLFLQISEIVILNQADESDGLNEKKKLIDNVENYAKHVCLTLSEQQEIYVGKSTNESNLEIFKMYFNENYTY
jgi:hypothetical protein